MTWSDWLGIAGLVTGIIGIYLAWHFYKRPFSGKSIGYMASRTVLISEKETVLPREVTVQYEGRNIRNLTKATCIIWNTGRTTIDGTDIVSAHGLGLRPPYDALHVHAEGCLEIGLDTGATLLKVSIDARSKQENGAEVWPDPEDSCHLYCKFRFLDPYQGFNIGILYTGVSSPCYVKGVIKGIPNGITMITAPRYTQTVTLVSASCLSGFSGILTYLVVYWMMKNWVMQKFSDGFVPVEIIPLFVSSLLVSGLAYAMLRSGQFIVSHSMSSKRPPRDLIG